MTLSFTDSALSKGTIEGQAFELDIVETGTGYHVIRDGACYRIDIVSVDHAAKSVSLRINHRHYNYLLQDRFDELLQKMGMGAGAGNKITSVKAPMPGLVLDVMIRAGEEIHINQPLIILEAMKMENVIKSPTAGRVKSVSAAKGASVEKNQLLIEFA